LYYSNFGFDQTDEGMALTIINNPFPYIGNVSQYGFIYYPIFKFLDGDIVAFRQINYCITILFSFILIFSSIRYLSKNIIISNSINSILSFGLSVCLGVLFNDWLITPNYNILVFQGLLIFLIGLNINIFDQKKRWLGLLLISLGGFVIFLGKPTSAIMLAVIFFILFFKQLTINKIASLIIFLLAISTLFLFLIDHSFFEFYNRMHYASSLYELTEHNLIKKILLKFIDSPFDYKGEGIYYFVIIILLLFLCSFWEKIKINKFYSLSVSVFFVFAVIFLILHPIQLSFNKYLLWILICIPIASFLYVFYIEIVSPYTKPIFLKYTNENKKLIALYILSPFILVFGTNTNPYSSVSQYSFIWVISSLFIILPASNKKSDCDELIPLVMASQILYLLIISLHIISPYRQDQPLFKNNMKFYIKDEAYLILSDERFNFFTKVREIFKSQGLFNKISIIDLTGMSPGLIYLIGGKSIGSPWINGGSAYHSIERLYGQLIHASCEDLSKSYILTEPKSQRAVDLRLLEMIGGNLAEDYKMVEKWRPSNYLSTEWHQQYLYQPVRVDKIQKNCILNKKEYSDGH